MSNTVLSHFSRLKPDPWRQSVNFSEDIDRLHREIFSEDQSESDLLQMLSDWLQKSQPCLFGRVAARAGALSYCVLTESDLAQPDELIAQKIQSARLRWTREAFGGKKSGFIIWVVSPIIAFAEPSAHMFEFARRICELYLEREIEPDKIYLDEIYLEQPGQLRTTWKWFAGVNYFCAQGDKRWWHDHRFPAGMAFSVNSVGHLVKSSIVAKAMNELRELLDAPDEGYLEVPIDSLERALWMAMQTIGLASDTVSGKATNLMPRPEDSSLLPVAQCPVKLPATLADKNFCEYLGYYHTDFTLPSEYFDPSVERPADKQQYSLDFTYLFRQALDNLDFIAMGVGKQIRQVPEEDETGSVEALSITAKNLMGNADDVSIDSEPRLRSALQISS